MSDLYILQSASHTTFMVAQNTVSLIYSKSDCCLLCGLAPVITPRSFLSRLPQWIVSLTEVCGYFGLGTELCIFHSENYVFPHEVSFAPVLSICYTLYSILFGFQLLLQKGIGLLYILQSICH